MLTRYDEFPVHQASKPFSHIPSTDFSWDEGYYFGAISADEKIFLATGLRVNPNADMVGAYVVLVIDGRHYTVRLSRCWRRQIDTVIGPLSYEFIEPLKTIRLKLEANDSALSFDITWTGVSPPFEESHHTQITRGRLTTDQTRYSQPGQVEGFIDFEGKRIDVSPKNWAGARDHSWGLYSDRKPLGGHMEWLPPVPQSGVPRAFHLWTCYQAGPWSGFYNYNLPPSGKPTELNDWHGHPFEGVLNKGWGGPSIKLVSAEHELTFQDNSRILKSGKITLFDEQGRKWQHIFDVACPPWVPQTTGYHPGSWKDGGTFHTYHGNEELVIEWDDFDWSVQPFDYTPYPPKFGPVDNAHYDSFRLVSGSKTHGVEFVTRNQFIEPDGTTHVGLAHVENFIYGRFDPYGFTD